MDARARMLPAGQPCPSLLAFVVATCTLLTPAGVVAQGMSGALIGTVKDAQGGVIQAAEVRVASPALIGGAATLITNDKGQLRFLALPPGRYALDVALHGFATYHEDDIRVSAGSTIERTVVLRVTGVEESIVVQGAGSRIEARDPGFATRFGPEDLKELPTRRTGMFDFIRAAPGISATSPSSGTATTVSAFGSGTNENQFLIDGTNFTCPCNGVARAEPGVDFIQEVHVQSVGASAEYGNVQGAVINVVTKQGSARFLYDASYFGQTAGLTSRPVVLPLTAPATGRSGYERSRYRDLTTNLGGPLIRDRLWFFAGYQYLRDYDSQPGTDAALPRTYEQDKLFVKLTWQLARGWQLEQSLHDEFWVNPEQPTFAKPFGSTLRLHASVPAVSIAHLTHTASARTVWDVRVGRFVYGRDDDPSSGDRTTASRFDRANSLFTGGPQSFGGLTLIRTTAKATLNHYRPSLLGADHQWKVGVQVERGESYGRSIIPTGRRFVDDDEQPFQSISSDPSLSGGLFITPSAFAMDAITLGDRLTVDAGVRFDHSRAVSQDLRALDTSGQETDRLVRGLGTLYTWNLFSPRFGATMKLTGDGRTMLRGSYGRFSQGVLTGEFSAFHPGVTPIATTRFDPLTGGYTALVSVVDSRKNLLLDSDIRAPRTDEYSVGVDREAGRQLALAVAYIHKRGADFIGWVDAGGQYRERPQQLPDRSTISVFELVNGTGARRFRLTNPADYAMAYNGLVLAVDKRRSNGWQAFGSYTWSRATGLQASSGTTAAGAQSSTVALPSLPFGRDPNDLTNATGRLPNDRPHALRTMGAIDVPRTGMVIAASLQIVSGKPWASTAQVVLPQGDQRILLEPRGSRRLSSQSLLDVRLSRAFSLGGMGRIDLTLDLLNALNDTAEEGLASDNLFSTNFGQPTSFVDPRRAMLGIRLNLGR